jgi:hypothetical protein
MRYLLALLIAGCAVVGPEAEEPVPPPSPDADTTPWQTPNALVLAGNYDQSCTRDDDCIAVFEGNACSAVQCANAAIRRDELTEYRAELGAYWSCRSAQTCAAGKPVMGDPAICVANKCVLTGL